MFTNMRRDRSRSRSRRPINLGDSQETIVHEDVRADPRPEDVQREPDDEEERITNPEMQRNAAECRHLMQGVIRDGSDEARDMLGLVQEMQQFARQMTMMADFMCRNANRLMERQMRISARRPMG